MLLFPFFKGFGYSNRDYENVIGVIDINKIILYFSSWYQSFRLWGSPVSAALLTAVTTIVHHHC